MDQAEILRRFDAEMRRAPVPPDPAYRVEQLAEVTRSVGPDTGAYDNCILWSGLDAASADAVIAREAAFFAGQGRALEWKLYGHDAPADLGRRLEAAGFVPEGLETVVALDLDGALPPPVEPQGATIERVVDPVRFGAIDDLMAAVYGADEDWRSEVLGAEIAAAPDRLSVYLAMADGHCVSAGWVRFHPGTGFADLWGGATRPHWRGRGIYRALVARRAAEAKARGFRFLTVDASSESRPILERLGFRALTTTTPYIREAGAA
ncbi:MULTISPECIES: GNAT family N-acetyltransferase [Inquilinus]|uniref:GNAT superfamily N-acetyltransferase n=1 Tax=Inquilinus ginsengisoli TaxID=363840 RepID=A0ABU1JU14_9PROT|nr:GNAT family N-acetyltransferase [Inquilinus ginsengisoli]MDR6291777.1 GNAT superfamily N-acetyltransferase [Inquilinus ginsengisoli]